jgi:hypothetical protein
MIPYARTQNFYKLKLELELDGVLNIAATATHVLVVEGI